MKKAWILIMIGLLAFASAVGADEPAEGRIGRSEVRFLEGMIDHHQMALDMAVDCLGKAQSAEITTMCQGVIDAQSAEIEQMQGWLLDWYGIQYAPVSILPEAPADHADHGGMHVDEVVTDPPMTMGMFAGFNRLEGVDYEIAWLESMVDHHDDAVHMSERVLNVAEHDPLRELAQTIIDVQTTEINAMESLIASLAG